MSEEDKAKEKAKELYNLYAIKWHHTTEDVKYYCTVLINEVLTVLDELEYFDNGGRAKSFGQDYWESVKEEIQKL